MSDENVIATETDEIMASKANDAADDAAMAEILGEPVGEAEPKVKDEEEEAEEKGEKEQPDDDDTETTADYDAAVEVLKRDGWTAEDLRGLSKKRVQAIADVSSKRQSDANTTWQKLQEAQKVRETTETKAEAATEPATETAELSKFVETLTDEIGEEAAGVLQKHFAAVEARAQAIQQRLDAAEARDFERMMTDARNRVGDRFPGLVDEKVFQDQVMPKLRTLVATGDYVDKVDEALTDAARLAGLEPSESNSTKPKSNRRNGTPTSGSRQTKTETLSEDEILEKAALLSIEGDMAGLRRMGLHAPAP